MGGTPHYCTPHRQAAFQQGVAIRIESSLQAGWGWLDAVVPARVYIAYFVSLRDKPIVEWFIALAEGWGWASLQ